MAAVAPRAVLHGMLEAKATDERYSRLVFSPSRGFGDQDSLPPGSIARLRPAVVSLARGFSDASRESAALHHRPRFRTRTQSPTHNRTFKRTAVGDCHHGLFRALRIKSRQVRAVIAWQALYFGCAHGSQVSLCRWVTLLNAKVAGLLDEAMATHRSIRTRSTVKPSRAGRVR